MARNKLGLKFEGWEEMITKLDSLGGIALMKEGTEKALIASKEYINPKIETAMAKANLPASGKYSFGRTKDAIDKEMNVKWEGLTANILIGFDMKEYGLTSIFLIYGTPRMSPVKGLKAIIYGSKTKKEIGEIQANIINNLIKKTLEG